MFSLDKFYNIIHNNLVSHFKNGRTIYCYPFGTYQHFNILEKKVDKFDSCFDQTKWFEHRSFFHCYFFDQEPIYNYTLPIIDKSLLHPASWQSPLRISVLVNSEHSEIKQQYLKSQNLYDWYYFFHGFAALDWYRDFRYLNPMSFNHFDKVFICYNHLTGNLRSYRLHLVANLLEKDLVKHGLVSLFHDGWKKTITDPDNPLDNRARSKIYRELKNLSEPLTIDTTEPTGTLSASINFGESVRALFHIVTETVYFDSKLHLTEKIFKPIVLKRPFMLVAAPGNLAYLKSYGFRTFDRWIDESYDNEPDHYIRIEKITAEIARLCAIDVDKLKQIHLEMQEVLEYNFNHFYSTFKDLIVDELVDNFNHVLCQINNGRQPGNHSKHHQRFEISPDTLVEVKTRLKQ